MTKKDSNKIEYPRFQQRISQENIDWLKEEVKNFGSWNKLFNEIIKRYKK